MGQKCTKRETKQRKTTAQLAVNASHSFRGQRVSAMINNTVNRNTNRKRALKSNFSAYLLITHTGACVSIYEIT